MCLDSLFMKELIILELENFVRNRIKNVPNHHGFRHVDKVRNYSKEICRLEGGDMFATEIAALAHDLGRAVEKDDHEKRPHSVLSVCEIEDFLKNLQDRKLLDSKDSEKIRTAIINHSSLPKKEADLMEKIIRDADRLTRFGISGIIDNLEYIRDQDLPFYIDEEKIFYGENEVMYSKPKSAIGGINFTYSWKNILELDSSKKMAEPELGVVEEFLELFSNHKEIRDYDFWINFLRYCQNGNCGKILEAKFKKYTASGLLLI